MTDETPLLRAGRWAWAVVGVVLLVVLATIAALRLGLLVVPLVLALFPAALLQPVARWLVERRVPPALAAAVVLLTSLAALGAGVALLVPAFVAQAPALSDAVSRGVELVEQWLPEIPFGPDVASVPELLRLLGRQIAVSGGDVVAQTIDAARRVVELAAATLFLLVALFFYLKDGRRITSALIGFAPPTVRPYATEVADRMWRTLGGYFRGQLLVALVDAVFIGVGLWLLGVPLVLPLAVLVLVGGLFPIVGALLSGLVAILVALADGGLDLALATLAVVLAVQQLESNVLAPLVMSRAVQLHPLTVLVALTIGGLLLGILGAFLAVPVAACIARLVEYVREQRGTAPPAPA